jgi:hypothetical protein
MGAIVPKGRPNRCDYQGNRNWRMTYSGFNRPFGTCEMANGNPAVNCRATLKSPSGRELTGHSARAEGLAQRTNEFHFTARSQ